MAGDNYIALINGLQQQKTSVQSSAGVADAGKIPALDSNGWLNFDIISASVKARSSAGGDLLTSTSAVALRWGSGGGANGTLYGGWNYDNATASTMAHFGASKTLESKTYAQTTALLDAMVGDSGSGGTKGLVPAPASGDAAANKYLKADGTWATVSGSGSPGGSTGQIQYNNAGSFGGWAAVVANSISGSSSTDNFFNLTATMPTTMTAATYAVRYDLTTAGSSSFNVLGNVTTLAAGYTGSSLTMSGQFVNNVSGTGATYGAASASNDYRPINGNYGIGGNVSNTTSGINAAVRALCNGSSTANYGGWLSATSSKNSAALNVGTASFALNATTNCAGFFGLYDGGTSAPTFSNAALIAENGSTTGDIIVARDNGTEVFVIEDGGVLNHQSAKVNKVRVVTGAGAVTVDAVTDYCIVINKSSGAATTVNLPSSPATGLTFKIKDGKGDAATNNITLTPAAGNIDGAATFVMNVNYQSAEIIYNGTEWNIV